MLKVFEAFAGIGAQAAALRNIGAKHRVVGISEIDKRAILGYERIHGPVKNFGDITKIDERALPEFDLFTYSFPCTDLSVAGKQEGLTEGSGTRSGLLWECQRIIAEKRPKYLLLENVPQLVGKKFKAEFDRWLKYLDSLGYNTYWKVLNARDYGIPQNRCRVFAVSILRRYDNGFKFSVPKCHKATFRSVKDKNPTDSLFHVCPSMVKAIYSGKCKIIDDGDVSACLTTKQQRWNNGGFVQEDKGIRYLSGLEQMRLMGFSDKDYKAISDFHINAIDHVCGNSIVVPVLESIFKDMLKYRRKSRIKPLTNRSAA
jgi:site-specific DNA-cytosine methylase